MNSTTHRRRWLPLAAATYTLSMLTYCSVRNSIRGAGNEPLVQLVEHRVSWMPRRSVRVAAVIRPITGASGCFGTLAVTLVLIVLGEATRSTRR